ncbi:MAG: glycosyltransferase family 2 protein [Armatimonadota bacterium]
MPEPLITVCTPVYNLEQYVGETLESLAAQTFKDFEVLIIDDGSTDDSAKVIKPFLSDPRFKYIYQDNAGVGAARNRAIQLAKGKWFAMLDGDDIYLPHALQTLADLAASDPKANLVYADMMLFREDGYEQLVFGSREMPEGDITKWLYHRPRFSTQHLMAKTADLRAIKGYQEHFPALEDYDLWLRLAHHGIWAKSTCEVIARYRVREGSKTSHIVRNTKLMIGMVEDAIERETRLEMLTALKSCLRHHRSRHELFQARADLSVNKLRAEKHLWKSFRNDLKQKRVLTSALICTTSRISHIDFGTNVVRNLLSGAFDLPWVESTEDND